MSYKFENYGSNPVQMLSTELNSLANGSGVTQATGTNAAFDNSNSTNLFFWADFELIVTFGSTPTADSSVELYIVPAEDGTNYATTTDGATPVVDKASYLGSFNIAASLSAMRRNLRGVPVPPCPFKLYAINKAGVAFPASGSLIKMNVYREQ